MRHFNARRHAWACRAVHHAPETQTARGDAAPCRRNEPHHDSGIQRRRDAWRAQAVQSAPRRTRPRPGERDAHRGERRRRSRGSNRRAGRDLPQRVDRTWRATRSRPTRTTSCWSLRRRAPGLRPHVLAVDRDGPHRRRSSSPACPQVRLPCKARLHDRVRAGRTGALRRARAVCSASRTTSSPMPSSTSSSPVSTRATRMSCSSASCARNSRLRDAAQARVGLPHASADRTHRPALADRAPGDVRRVPRVALVRDAKEHSPHRDPGGERARRPHLDPPLPGDRRPRRVPARRGVRRRADVPAQPRRGLPRRRAPARPRADADGTRLVPELRPLRRRPPRSRSSRARRTAARFVSVRAGYDPAYGSHRVGAYLLAKAIEDLIDDPQLSVFDFGLGDAEYKRKLAHRSIEEGDLVVYARRARPIRINLARTGSSRGVVRRHDESPQGVPTRYQQAVVATAARHSGIDGHETECANSPPMTTTETHPTAERAPTTNHVSRARMARELIRSEGLRSIWPRLLGRARLPAGGRRRGATWTAITPSRRATIEMTLKRLTPDEIAAYVAFAPNADAGHRRAADGSGVEDLRGVVGRQDHQRRLARLEPSALRRGRRVHPDRPEGGLRASVRTRTRSFAAATSPRWRTSPRSSCCARRGSSGPSASSSRRRGAATGRS